jgi:trk system potassium uptake protein TrkH
MKNNRARSTKQKFQPAQVLAISFLIAILTGAVLLMLPFSTHDGRMSLSDALFTSTSAVCVTGLIVQDTSTYFTITGKIVILILFQLGGLGIMTFSTLILLVSGKKISFKDQILIQEGYHPSGSKSVKELIKNIFVYSIVMESFGILILFLRWRGDFLGPQALFQSLFHSVSAFCNAGFSLFSDSFVAYRSDTVVNLTLLSLIVLGGLGFLVLQEIKLVFTSRIKKKKLHLSLHSRLVVTVTLVLIIVSGLLFLILEWNSSMGGFTLKEKLLSSFFQVITARTAGFNTMDLNSLGFAVISLLIFLMFIGASPGSTGGGIKTSTIGVLTAFLKSKIQARESVNMFRRTLPLDVVTKAFTLVILSISVIFVASFLLFLTQPGATMRTIFFEAFSAFGTVGLSLGITPELTDASKIILTLTMYIGRIGPLTLLYAFSRAKAYGRFEYSEETVMIG